MSDTRDDLPRGDGPEDDVHADAAAYALDALDDAARTRFEEHLATCAACRSEVADLQEAAAALVLAEPVPAPPPGLRASVLAAVRDVEQLPPERHLRSTPTGASVGSPRPRRALVDDEADLGDQDDAGDDEAARPAGGGPDPVVDELALRRANRRTRLLSVLVAAVTVVALALGFTVWGMARQQPPPVAGPAPSATVPGVDPSLLAAPDVRVYATTVNGAAASFVVSKSQDRAVFVSADLPAPAAGDVYHLWTLEGTTVRPDATFTASGAATQELTGPIASSTNLAINVEPEGTDPQAPTTPVLGIVEL